MIHLKKILLATDFSSPADNALMYAKALAEAFGASIDVIHAIEEQYAQAGLGPGFAGFPYLFDEQKEFALQQFEQMFSDEERDRFSVNEQICKGTPFVEIIKYAREINADLIVMATHGRGAVAHLLLGSVAERVVRKSPCPVLTVRFPEHEFVMP